jgi:GNAT superfamily N-acetyltransferase
MVDTRPGWVAVISTVADGSYTHAMIDLRTPRLCLHPLTVAEGMRIVDGTPAAEDTWAADFPREDDRDGIGGFLSAAATGADPTPFGTYRIDAAAAMAPDANTAPDTDPDTDGTAIGTIGFFGPPDDDGQVTIGYGLVPGARGLGYATEAVGALVEFCRSRDDVRALLADTDTDNGPSQGVLTKNGFEFVREDDKLRYYRLDLSSRPRR